MFVLHEKRTNVLTKHVSRSARRLSVVGGLEAAPRTLCGLNIGDEKREQGDRDSRSAVKTVFALWRQAVRS